nr:DUF305 domain-containing protein [Ilumatobacter coccineus]
MNEVPDTTHRHDVDQHYDTQHHDVTPEHHADAHDHDAEGNDAGSHGVHMSYGRFAAMIATSTIVMFGLMYLNTYSFDHVRWSETRFYMALLMGSVMAFIMLGFMLSMYKSTKINIAIFVASIVVFAASLGLVRSQATVQDTSWMRAMIPHHSIAILTSERAEIDDVRVCELATSIIEAQQREIDEMDWLIDDIAENGKATTAAEAAERPVPEFTGDAIRSCP